MKSKRVAGEVPSITLCMAAEMLVRYHREETMNATDSRTAGLFLAFHSVSKGPGG